MFYKPPRAKLSRRLQSLYRKFKKFENSERINLVEHGSFTPMVSAACGGMGRVYHDCPIVIVAGYRTSGHFQEKSYLNFLVEDLKVYRGPYSIKCVLSVSTTMFIRQFENENGKFTPY